MARLSRLHSSNECNRFGGDINAISLQALDGIGPALERILNAAGIHHIEQLANLSDRELIELPIQEEVDTMIFRLNIWLQPSEMTRAQPLSGKSNQAAI